MADPASPCPPAAAARLRGVLLEFLKFRVLAAQDAFFTDLGSGGRQGPLPATAAPRLRIWLRGLGVRQFERLEDADLLMVLEASRRLYLD